MWNELHNDVMPLDHAKITLDWVFTNQSLAPSRNECSRHLEAKKKVGDA